MKIAFRELETVRANPVGFGRQLAAGGSGGPMSRGYFMDWRDAVLRWHSGREAAIRVRMDLQSTLERRFTAKGSEKRIAETLTRFDQHVQAFDELKYRAPRTRMDVSVPADDMPKGQFQVSGEVAILAREGTRYVAILLLSNDVDWQNELRAPLIQDATASKLNLLPGEISVGAYFYLSGEYEERQFTASEVLSSKAELADLLEKVEQGLRS